MILIRYNAIAMIAGLILDLLIGDPQGWPHPVIWIGKWISFCDKKIRAKAAGDSAKLRRGTVWMTASTVLLSMAVTAAVLRAAAFGGTYVLLAAMTIISWTCLAT